MARQAASNTFSDGMVKDLNPITMPNSALSDCVNGTIITYNGNELMLQNDMGNYGLQDCKLPENYIPVGLKEYGNILYIVSYNPIDKTVEIGSYPSPVESTTSEANSDPITIQPISSMLGDNTYTDYSALSENIKTQYFITNNLDLYKINPGDKYKLIQESPEVLNSAEELKFYILDENKVEHDITSYIEYGNEYKPVKWQIPGWLGVQCDVKKFNECWLGRKSIVFTKDDETYSATWKGKVQIKSDVPLVDNNDSFVYVRYKINKTDDQEQEGEWQNEDSVQLKSGGNVGGTYYYIANIEIDIPGLHVDESVEIVFEPCYKFDNDHYVCFDKEHKSNSFTVQEDVNVSELKIGEDTFRYYTPYVELNNSDEDFILSFNTAHFQNDGSYTLQYKIVDGEGALIVDWADCSEWYDDAVSEIRIQMSEYFEDNYGSETYFCPENNYTIYFQLLKNGEPVTDFDEQSYSFIATRLFNDAKVEKYYELKLSDYIDNYEKVWKKLGYDELDVIGALEYDAQRIRQCCGSTSQSISSSSETTNEHGFTWSSYDWLSTGDGEVPGIKNWFKSDDDKTNRNITLTESITHNHIFCDQSEHDFIKGIIWKDLIKDTSYEINQKPVVDVEGKLGYSQISVERSKTWTAQIAHHVGVSYESATDVFMSKYEDSDDPNVQIERKCRLFFATVGPGAGDRIASIWSALRSKYDDPSSGVPYIYSTRQWENTDNQKTGIQYDISLFNNAYISKIKELLFCYGGLFISAANNFSNGDWTYTNVINNNNCFWGVSNRNRDESISDEKLGYFIYNGNKIVFLATDKNYDDVYGTYRVYKQIKEENSRYSWLTGTNLIADNTNVTNYTYNFSRTLKVILDGGTVISVSSNKNVEEQYSGGDWDNDEFKKRSKILTEDKIMTTNQVLPLQGRNDSIFTKIEDGKEITNTAILNSLNEIGISPILVQHGFVRHGNWYTLINTQPFYWYNG